MADVFISYSSKDIASAEYLLKNLESMYLTCWMAPRDIPTGENFADYIPSAIRNAKILLVLVSQNSLESPQVLNELTFASHIGLPRIAVSLDDTPFNNAFEYHIAQENRFNGKGRLVAASSELVSHIHSELEQRASARQEQNDNRDLRKLAPMLWVITVAGIAAILILVSCVFLMLQAVTIQRFMKNIITIIILALMAASLILTPLFRDDHPFFCALLKLLEKLRSKM